jgi:hypothetical protein
MPEINPYSLAIKAFAAIAIASGLLGIGWHYGDYYRGLECDIAAAKATEAAAETLRNAIEYKTAVESRLAAISHQIDIDDAKRQTEIDHLRDDNRRLAQSLRLRKPAACPSGADAVPESAGAASSADEADPIAVSVACARAITELAADADRVRDQAIAGQQWAIKIRQEFNQ